MLLLINKYFFFIISIFIIQFILYYIIFNFISIFSITIFIINIIIIMTALLPSAYISLFERQIIGVIQNRLGPIYSGGIFSILQPIFDGLKLFFKKPNINFKYNNLNLIIPNLLFSISLIIWLTFKIVNNKFDYDIIFFILILILVGLTLFFLGLIIKNKYTKLSIIRYIIIIISIDICLIILVSLSTFRFGNFNLNYIINISFYSIISLLPVTIIMFLFLVADGRKSPFDISKSEAEMASDYMIEFSSLGMALLIISEYLLFFSMIIFFLKIFINISYLFILIILFLILYFIIRSILPNYRFNDIFLIFWKNIFPIILSILLFFIIFLI